MLIVRTLIPEISPIHISSGGTRHWNENQYPKDLQGVLSFATQTLPKGVWKDKGVFLWKKKCILILCQREARFWSLYPSMSLGTWKCFDIKKKKNQILHGNKIESYRNTISTYTSKHLKTYTEWGRKELKISSSDWWMWLFAKFYWW